MPAPLILGWEEWVALPDLGLPAVKAKVDTGARTSALHAAAIEPFGPAAAPMVRFVVHPHPARPEIAVSCAAPVVGRREVTSSNGDSESRFVIATTVRIGGRSWPIEVTLTNRETMSYRMLLGRQAIGADMIVEPGTSFRQPKLNYRPYRNLPRREAVVRPLRLAVVTRRPEAASSRRLAEAAAARGHALELIDPGAVTLTFRGARPGVMMGGAALGPFDAVIPRVGGGALGPALVRQLELTGSFALNSGDALERMQHPVAVVQALIRAGLDGPITAIEHGADRSPAAVPRAVAEPPERGLRMLLVDHKVIAAVELRRGRIVALDGRPPAEARRVARRVTRTLRLGLACVDVARTGMGTDGVRYGVVAVATAPLLSPLERVAGVDVVGPIIAAIEAHVGQ